MPRNLLVGVCLHAAARLYKGMSNSGLERRMLDMLRTIGADDDEIKKYGEMYADFHARRANAEFLILPQSVTDHELDKEYGDTEFLRDVKALTKEIVALDGNRIMNISDTSMENGDDEAHGSSNFGVTVFTGAKLTTEYSDATTDGCKLVLSKFKVHSRVSDGRAETYWLTAVGSDIKQKQLPDGSYVVAAECKQSEAFKAITEGQVLNFKDQVLYNGKVNKYLACHVICWEADDSSDDFYTRVRETLYKEGEELIAAAAAVTDDASWDSNEALLALVATVTGFEHVLLTLASQGEEHDFRSDRTIAFTVEGLTALQSHPTNGVALYFDLMDSFAGRNELFIQLVYEPCE